MGRGENRGRTTGWRRGRIAAAGGAVLWLAVLALTACESGSEELDIDACPNIVCPANATCLPATGECVCDSGYVRRGDTCVSPDDGDSDGDAPDGDIPDGDDADGDGLDGDTSDLCETVDCPEHATCDPATGACDCDEGYVWDGEICAAEVECDEDADCADDDLCDGVETCVEGACRSGGPVDCGAPGICMTAVTCDPATGFCEPAYAADGADCGDGLACNGAETCDGAGTCDAGEPVVCEDNLVCSEPAGDCACESPFYWEDGVCRGPNRLAPIDDLGLAEESFYNGADGAGGFISHVARFSNAYNAEFQSWDGFAAGTMTDVTTPGYGNQYSAIAGGGAQGTDAYAMGYVSAFATEPPSVVFTDAGDGYALAGMYVTNSTYAYLAMRDGDDFSKQFGGESGDDPDWFMLTVTGHDASGDETGAVDFYLADYRFESSEEDYLINAWIWVDLRSLGPVVSLSFSLNSSDVGEWGMNTPAYFAIDEITRLADYATAEDVELSGPESFWNGSDGTGGAVSGGAWFANAYDAEFQSWDGFAVSNTTDATTPGYGNQYSAIAGQGVGESANYFVGYLSSFAPEPPTVSFFAAPEGQTLSGVYVTNTTYAYLAMRDGDAFSKRFGGETGDDPDWFLLTITGHDANGDATGDVEFYLADYRSANNEEDYLIDDWTWVDLSSLGTVTTLTFTLSSSDVGEWGMNTPAYFALDNLNRQLSPEP